MSSRQRNKLCKKDNLDSLLNGYQKSHNDSESENSAENSDLEVQLNDPRTNSQIIYQQAFLTDQDFESSESNSDEEPKLALKPAFLNKQSKNSNESLKDSQDEDELLEEFIKANHQTALSEVNEKLRENSMSSFFLLNPKDFDIDVALRKKNGFDISKFENQFGRPKRGKSSSIQRELLKKNSRRGNKKLIFGLPKDDWKKPPSFIGGGIGMIQLNKYSKTFKSQDSKGLDNLKCSVNKETDQNEQESIQTKAENLSEYIYRLNTSCYSMGEGYQEYQFNWSKEFQKLNKKFEYVKNTGDPNRLVMFLAHFPYHMEALSQLSLIYAKIGNMERSLDLIRHSIYCFESGFTDSFRPYELNCVLDPNIYENYVFFLALFRYIQMVSFMELHELASDLSRLAFKMNPLDDKVFMLLCLDHHLLKAKKYQDLQLFCGIYFPPNTHSNKEWFETSAIEPTLNDNRSNTIIPDLLSLPIHQEVETLLKLKLDFSFITEHWEVPEQLLDKVMSISKCDGPQREMSLGPAFLPNWWFSLALSFWLKDEDQNNELDTSFDSKFQPQSSEEVSRLSQEDNKKIASLLLKAAVLKWTFILPPLLTKIGVIQSYGITTTSSSDWNPIISNYLFQTASQRIPPNSYLHHLKSIFCSQNSSIWAKDEIKVWLSCTIGDLFHRIETEKKVDIVVEYQKSLYQVISSPNFPFQKYKSASLEDFLEDIPRFPDGLNPIDPQLDDPLVLQGGMRFELFLEELNDRNAMNQSRNQKFFSMDGLRNISIGVNSYFTLDLSLPLLQLFLMSFFPWFRLS